MSVHEENRLSPKEEARLKNRTRKLLSILAAFRKTFPDVKTGRLWRCTLCAEEPLFQYEDARQHFVAYHAEHMDGGEALNAKGTLVMHADGDDFTSRLFEWKTLRGKIVAYSLEDTERKARR